MSLLVEQMLHGNRYALARLISAVENRMAEVLPLMNEIYPHLTGIMSVGITGPPGAGKSTVVDRLIQAYRNDGKKVAVIAVDPSSPFSGGAILGDRIRMQSHALDAGVFIRSLGSRGHYGGLSIATAEVLKLFDAAGFDVVLIETVGVGQTEFSVMEVADTVVVLLVPESGDTIQTMKAGLLEVADLFAVNKADREGADRIQAELQNMLHLRPEREGWQVPVLPTIATRGTGIPELVSKISEHRRIQDAQRGLRTAALRVQALEGILLEELHRRIQQAVFSPHGSLREVAQAVEAGTINPYEAALSLLTRKGALERMVENPSKDSAG